MSDCSKLQDKRLGHQKVNERSLSESVRIARESVLLMVAVAISYCSRQENTSYSASRAQSACGFVVCLMSIETFGCKREHKT